MPTKTAANEREQFRERLVKSLTNAGFKDSPTELAREYNLRSRTEPVTVHAVRKWLFAEAIPTQGKLRVLAHMLGVSEQWLRYGDVAAARGVQHGPLKPQDSRLLTELHSLGEHDQSIARDFIHMLARKGQRV